MGGLISQMAKWAYGDVQRAEARQPVTVEEIDRTPYEDDDLARVLDRDEIARLVPVLSDRERLVVERMLEDASDAEVAAELDVEPNNLHQIRWRAMNRLRAAAEQAESGT